MLKDKVYQEIENLFDDNVTPGSMILSAGDIKTPIGTMIAIADETRLYILDFLDSKTLLKKMRLLKNLKKATLIRAKTTLILSIEQELTLYFQKKLTQFKTPYQLFGTLFQHKVWMTLAKIPLGSTWSYTTLATQLGQTTAVRAVGNANGANALVILVPCHRVIAHNGSLGGYSGGLDRKRWLLHHEQAVL